MTSVLRIDSSPRSTSSVSRQLGDRILARLGAAQVVSRDITAGLAAVDADWIGANFTPEAERTADQRAVLALSDSLVAELQAADTVLITLPIWNFGIPSTLKAWIDQVARAGVTFRYTPEGPVGLLEGKRAILAVASGGTEVGSAIDFATDYLRHVLGFIGIHEVEIVAADRLMVDAEASHAKADAAIDALAA
ncbi:NAD(P)H-dependent oxidoreductase [Dinoroseobacter sp. PD6]|uniref:FMN-dependent NADH-azoreductase n=1 Tax=Dinoroseobacter sp. PD6 TaxID=3028384 RepID=UPI00237ABDE4|nr:NAD(P)H-dependent oxidoreductase [Dinoroseobacter sp. PD6]MDD9718897.1 NAD(P)H-dependent oxidoreductase [Dinoroseobacter sp. PD6]